MIKLISKLLFIPLLFIPSDDKFKKDNEIIIIEYKLHSSIGGIKYEENSILKCNLNQSIFFVENQKENKTIIDENDDSKIHIQEKNIENYKTIDLNTKTLFSKGYIENREYKIGEVLPVMNWVLSQDKSDIKKINNYSCKKATLSFRGREYVAWYTTKIAFPFGPWKFHGLPGIILEISDVNNIYNWTAIKINKSKKEKIDFEVFKKSEAEEIPLKDYIEKKEKSAKMKSELMLKKLPSDIILKESISTRLSIELVYEWEKQ